MFLTFFLPLFYATFQCGPYNIFKKKKKKNHFLPMKTLKKRPQELLIIGPKLFFHSIARLPKPAQNWFFILWICPKTHLSTDLWYSVYSNATYFSKKASSSLIWSCCWLCMSFLRTSSCACKCAFINSQFSFWCRSIISDQCFVCSTMVCFTAGSLTTSLSLENKIHITIGC